MLDKLEIPILSKSNSLVVEKASERELQDAGEEFMEAVNDYLEDNQLANRIIILTALITQSRRPGDFFAG